MHQQQLNSEIPFPSASPQIQCAHCFKVRASVNLLYEEDCGCLLEDLEYEYWLWVELPNLLREYKEKYGEYPVRAWNRHPL